MNRKNVKKVLFTLIGTGVFLMFGILSIGQKSTEAGWIPGSWLNQNFWDSNPSTGNIIAALYGDGTLGSSDYNRYWDTTCIPSNVVFVSSIPGTINANTIYVLNSGNYATSSTINMADCSAIVGRGKVRITSTTSNLITISSNNTIIDNVALGGNASNTAILFSGFKNNTINKLDVDNFQIGISLNKSNYNNLNNIKIYNNVGALSILGSNNYVQNSQFYNNSSYGIQIVGQNGSGNIPGETSKNNTINNILSFNNAYGVYIQSGRGSTVGLLGTGGGVQYNTIINSQFFNNSINGIRFQQPLRLCQTGSNNGYSYSVSNNLIKNSIFYNHTGIGLNFNKADSSSSVACVVFGGYMEYESNYGQITGNLIDDSYFYNNNLGIRSLEENSFGSITPIYTEMVGNINFFDNNNDWTGGIYGSYTIGGQANHISYSWSVNPISSIGIKLLSGTDRLSLRGKKIRTVGEPTKYVFGKDIIKQIQPVKYSGTNLINFGVLGKDWNPTEYIAAINMELNSYDQQIVSYYYGANSDFIKNWGQNNCSLGALTVEYINSSNINSKLISNNPLGHTIYVLEDDTYNITSTININENCVAIINRGSGAILNRVGTSQNPLVRVFGKENIIVDGFDLQGNNASDNGILLERNGNDAASNNTINNVRSFGHRKNGIMLDMLSSNNTIMNTQVWNNNDYGIEIYFAGNYNVINNSLSYNNGKYGIRFGNGSKYNTINNSQFFNNGMGGIFADFTTEQNIINNVHVYNNTDYGINFKRSSGNKLNNIYAYNNNIGINIEDVSCVNNTFNGYLNLFENNSGNLQGTSGNDTYFKNGNAISNVGWFPGNMPTLNYTMSCVLASNPRDGTSWLLSSTLDCGQTGNLTWSPWIGNNVEYMFGLGISKQIAPVGYNVTSIVPLTNQFMSGSYIGEVNKILWTDPGNIIINSISGTNNLEPDTTYELSVSYNSGMVNTNFNMTLTLDPTYATGYIKVKTGNTRHNIGTGIVNIDYANIQEIRLNIKTLSGYKSTISGELYMGTNDYGYGIGIFTLTTKLDPTPPSVNWVKNIDNNIDGTNTWQVNLSGIYNISGRYAYVTGSSDCHSGIINSGGISYNNNVLINAVSNPAYSSFDGKYVCIYVIDNDNNQESTGLSNQIIIHNNVPSIIRSSNITPGGLRIGQTNTWQANISGTYNVSSWYAYVTGANNCNSGISMGGIGTSYNGNLMYASNHSLYTTFNNRYVCIFARDNVNQQSATTLSNQIKISKLEFVDNIDAGPVYHDLININFQNVYNYGYRRVNSGNDCNDSLSGTYLIPYNGQFIINNDSSFNGKYLCAYAEDSTGSGKYLVSNHDVNISDYSDTVRFTDDVSDIWIFSDTISVFFSGSVTFTHKLYKRVNQLTECNNSGGMVSYTGDININNDSSNGKYFCLYTREQGGIENYLVSSHSLKIDTTSPTIPNINSPLNGQNIYFIDIKTNGASDLQSGLTGFEYQIAQNATFLDIVASGTYYTTGTNVIPDFDGNEATYAIRVRAVDNVGNKSIRSNVIEFNYKNMIGFNFNNVTNAQIGTAYTSNEIQMLGLGVNEIIRAEVTNGTLYRNGSPRVNGSFVQNNDMLSIRLMSSNNYSGTVQSDLKIANRKVNWKITTMQSGGTSTGIVGTGASGFNLTPNEILAVEAIFNSIINMYPNQNQLKSFLLVMKSMLQDNIALAGSNNVENLRYLLHLIDQYLNNNFNNLTGNLHIAPNCKEYIIAYNTGENTYYSPNTIKQTKFGSRDELIKFLDSHNPGDCNVNIYGNTVSYDNTNPNRHIAPNGKVYRIELNNIGYSSPDFVNIRYFASINELRSFIDKSNPAITVWNHNVDIEFEPIVHSAPNGKTYKIYKTNRGFMSYKLIKVQYFETLEELKKYIDRNNK